MKYYDHEAGMETVGITMRCQNCWNAYDTFNSNRAHAARAAHDIGWNFNTTRGWYCPDCAYEEKTDESETNQ